MTPTDTPEYRQLSLDSSNDLIRFDSCWIYGEYLTSAFHALRAGFGRVRMGQIKFDLAEFVHAAEDWLSASACFYLATAPERLRTILDRVVQLNAAEKIPHERRDLHAAIAEREQQHAELTNKIEKFLHEYWRMGGPTEQRTDVLNFCLRQVRELPGYAQLHYLIYHQATELGNQKLALEHVIWAATFDPKPYSVTLAGSLAISCNEPELAITLGKEYLDAHPEPTPAPVRLMLAQAFASNVGGHVPDQAQAIEVLRPVMDRHVEAKYRIVALVLSAAYCHELGHAEEFRLLVEQLSQSEREIVDPEIRAKVWELRRLLPVASLNGSVREPNHPHSILPDATRRSLFERSQQRIA